MNPLISDDPQATIYFTDPETWWYQLADGSQVGPFHEPGELLDALREVFGR